MLSKESGFELENYELFVGACMRSMLFLACFGRTNNINIAPAASPLAILEIVAPEPATTGDSAVAVGLPVGREPESPGA